jgi:hypothetical protein
MANFISYSTYAILNVRIELYRYPKISSFTSLIPPRDVFLIIEVTFEMPAKSSLGIAVEVGTILESSLIELKIQRNN